MSDERRISKKTIFLLVTIIAIVMFIFVLLSFWGGAKPTSGKLSSSLIKIWGLGGKMIWL